MASAAVVSCAVVALLLVSIVPGAHPTTPAVESSCGAAELIRLLPCLPFAEGDVPAPSDTCCANLGSMVHDEPLCLCQALGPSSSGGFPVPVNVSRALQLTHLCRLDLPPAAAACAGIPPGGAAPSPPVNVPRSNASSSTVPSTPSTLPTPPPPPSTSRQMPEYSTGVKLIAGCAPVVAHGFLALVSALTLTL
ncbi:hypothetical protein GUJ93_ZPchr0014g46732 [Zizania palustris]|uniref:Bifunctional inhibitor/plant lipid transfer protein/seed storage helical domain-containing protein n=1 Tax=Zizania palustris TaxID=103762 RepID=A0A8J5TA29_ZIZPA|nr:hypothetical protein GUJ93_ZPchr0014g46732 [Zizania palustris]